MPEAAAPHPTIRDAGERPLVLHSRVLGPLADTGFLARALVLAELAMLAYNDLDEASRGATAIGFEQVELIDRHGAQAMLFRNSWDVVVACRGTEPDQWNDLHADANALLAAVGTLGRVHSGFNREVNDIWPDLKTALRALHLPVWISGHSLGGAMATICAYRCRTSSLALHPRELHTFGSPRVGCARYSRLAGVTHFRWVHNNDIVTRLPPPWLGYRHGGHEVYLDHAGQLSKLSRRQRKRDRRRGLFQALASGRIDWLADHGVHQYIAHIAAAVAREREAQVRGLASPGLDDWVSWAVDDPSAAAAGQPLTS